MITCETAGMMWTIEGKIEGASKNWQGPHAGIGELSYLLAQHVGRLAKIRVELIDGPRPGACCPSCGSLLHERCYGNCQMCGAVFLTEDKRCPVCKDASEGNEVAAELKQMHSLVTEVQRRLSPGARGPVYASTLEARCIEMLADAMLILCDQLEALDRRLQRLQAR